MPSYTLLRTAIEPGNDVNALPPVSTPCINVCAIDARSGLCTGCARSLEEIARWSRLTERERRAVMETLPARLAAMLAK
ncbi:DUF1289 domain-containing protein [Parvibaculum sedimenti]|uniref:DUF1289 domain-containing protein n=1 Tax=Parvibaculum sedimenti TaxID=2608632 RepID=UPI003BB4B985